MFELNGQQYTIEQVQEAANQSNLTFDEYISQVGLKEIKDNTQNFQTPTFPGADVGRTAAPDMESKSESSFLDLSIPTGVPGINVPLGINLQREKDKKKTAFEELVNAPSGLFEGDEEKITDWQKIKNAITNQKYSIQQFDENLKVDAYQFARKLFGDEAVDEFVKNPKVASIRAMQGWTIPGLNQRFYFADLMQGLTDDEHKKDLEEIDRLEKKKGKTGELIEGFKTGDPGEVLAGVVNAFASLGEAAVVSTATGGVGLYTNFWARGYINVNEEKAKKHGVSTAEFLSNDKYADEVDYDTGFVTGTIAGWLERIGLGKVTGRLPIKGINKTVRRLKAGSAEANTELGQSLLETIEKSIGNDYYDVNFLKKENRLQMLNDVIGPDGALWRQETWESWAQGFVGGAGFKTASNFDGKDAKNAAIAAAGITTAATLGGDAVVLMGGLTPFISNRAASRLRSESNKNKMDVLLDEISTLQNKIIDTDNKTIINKLEKEITKKQNEIKSIIKEDNAVINQTSEKDLKELANIKDIAGDLNKELAALQELFKDGKITKKEYDFQRKLLIEEYNSTKEEIDNKVSDISEKNRITSEKNETLITELEKNQELLKNENLTKEERAPIERAIEKIKNDLTINNSGLIDKLTNQSFNSTLDTDMLKEDLRSEIAFEFAKMINTYKSEFKTPFGAYAAQNLPLRLGKGGIFDRLIETKINPETGEREIISKQDVTQKQVEGEITTQKEPTLENKKELKKKLLTKKLEFDKTVIEGEFKIDEETGKQVPKTFADIFIDAVAKTFQTKLPAITDKNFIKEFSKNNIAELMPFVRSFTKIDRKKGIDKFKPFIIKNWKSILDQLPPSVINKKYDMLRKPVLKETGKQKREATAEGKGEFEYLGMDRKDFVDYFTNPNPDVIATVAGKITVKDKNGDVKIYRIVKPKKDKPLGENEINGTPLVGKRLGDEITVNGQQVELTKIEIGSATLSDRRTSLLETLINELSADAALKVVNDKAIMQKFKDIQELEGREVPTDLEKAILKTINRIDQYLEKRANDKSLRVEIIPGVTILHNMFDIFIKQVRNGLQQGLTFAKALEGALNVASKYFHNAKDFESFRKAAEVLNEDNIGDSKTLKQLQKEWEIANLTDLKKYGVETSFTNYLTLQLKEAGTLKNQQAVLKIALLAEARSIKNIDKNYISTNQDLVKKIRPILKKINPKLATAKEGIGVKVKLNKKTGEPVIVKGKILYELTVAGEVINISDPKDTFKKSIKKGEFSESIEIANTARTYFDNLMQHYIDTGNTKDGVAHIKLLAINQRGLLRKLAKPNLYVNLNEDLDNTTLEHDPPVSQFVEAAIDVLQNPKKYDKFKSNILDNYHINLIPNKIDNLLTKIGLKENLPEGADIFSDPNARMKAPEIAAALNKNKNILDLKDSLAKEDAEILNSDFNKILEDTKGIPADERVSEASARVQGKKAERIRMWVPFTAEDLKGLLYRWAGKGKDGDRHLKWIKTNITDVLSNSLILYDAAKVKATQKLQDAKKAIRGAGIDLGKEAILGYSNDQAIRIFMWHRKKIEIPGVPKAEAKKVYIHVRKNLNFLQYAEQIENIFEEGEFPAPKDKGWTASTITKDFLTHFNTKTRQTYLKPFYDNINAILGDFDVNTGRLSGEGTNKLRKLFGNTYIKALENSLYRIYTGKNRSYQLDKQGGLLVEWWNQAIGNIMFFNTRSATLQQISFTNFVNWTDNNPLKAASAFANLPQFISDFTMIFNSDYLKQRRAGLKTDINEQEIATAAELSTNKVRAILAAILKKGFVLTQMADSFAIALGGATFYRNRLQTYKKQGLTKKEAEEKAFKDFREISEETQQSARPDKISMEQSGLAGRFILNFQNTPMQYNRLAKRAMQDLINRRGDAKTNISKIIYYLGAQNALFYSLQQGLFAVLFDDDDEEEMTMTDKERYFNLANGMADSVLRGSGIFGAAASTAKNVVIELIEQERRDDPDVVAERKERGLKKQQRDWIDIIEKTTAISPPINSKFRKLTKHEYLYESNKERKKIKEIGLDTRNPAVIGAADLLSVSINLPADRVLRKIENVRTALGEETELWQSIALMLGWGKWELNIQDKPPAAKTSGLRPPPKRVRKSDVKIVD